MLSKKTSVRSRPFIITGCGRSGTMFSSRLFTALGVPCTHEKVFTARWVERVELRAGEGESSWLAVPHLGVLPRNTLVLHQVREPLATIRSYLDSGWFRYGHRADPLWKHCTKRLLRKPPSWRFRASQIVRTTAPEVFREASPEAMAGRFWAQWNKLVASGCENYGHEYVRYRLEDMNAEFVDDLLERIGVQPRRPVAGVLEQIGTSTNTRPKKSSLTIHDLGRAATDVRQLGASYGYDL